MELIPKTNPLYFIDALYLTLKLAPWDLPNHACRAMQYQFQNDSNTKPAAPNPARTACGIANTDCAKRIKSKQEKFIEISYITIKRMDNTPFASMLFFADLRIVAHLMENINHV
jgi:hypothetical protein